MGKLGAFRPAGLLGLSKEKNKVNWVISIFVAGILFFSFPAITRAENIWNLEISEDDVALDLETDMNTSVSMSIFNPTDETLGYKVYLYNKLGFECLEELSGTYITAGEILPEDIHVVGFTFNNCNVGTDKLIFAIEQTSHIDPQNMIAVKRKYFEIDLSVVSPWQVEMPTEIEYRSGDKVNIHLSFNYTGTNVNNALSGSIYIGEWLELRNVICECNIVQTEPYISFTSPATDQVNILLVGVGTNRLPFNIPFEAVFLNLSGAEYVIKAGRLRPILYIPAVLHN
ncbi:MAG: hypothetical protein WDZ94_04915 [Patescibacteria group bacterium]